MTLHFAELDWDEVGQRIFNIDVEGTQFWNIDILQMAGGITNKAVTIETVVVVSDGFLSISLTNAEPQVGQAKISGIEIKPFPDLLINCGGDEYFESSGDQRVWLADDQYFVGGITYFDGSSPIENTQDDFVRIEMAREIASIVAYPVLDSWLLLLAKRVNYEPKLTRSLLLSSYYRSTCQNGMVKLRGKFR